MVSDRECEDSWALLFRTVLYDEVAHRFFRRYWRAMNVERPIAGRIVPALQMATMSNAGNHRRELSAKLRSLPSVDRILSEAALGEALERWPRVHVVDAVRTEVDVARTLMVDGRDAPSAPEEFANLAERALRDRLQLSLRHVVNATGVVIHTNLGRAPVSDAAALAMTTVAGAYSNLEYDLESGARGSRSNHLESLLQATTGAEAGIAVNNNAAALYLAISGHCAGKQVIISRGQSVEIGGGFRIPDVLRDAGAELVEVGTTNRTRPDDYAEAVTEQTAAILRVHSSNFRIVGFAEEPTLSQLREVADEAGIMLIDDIGSGCLLDTRDFHLAYEPRPQDSIDAGADLVLFSGDKLLGGPQGGVIIGNQGAVSPLRRHPLMRALRLDKAAIAGIAVTLQHYLAEEAVDAIPIWRMIATDASELQSRAEMWRTSLGAGDVEPSESPIGGGSLPTETRPTFVWSLAHAQASDTASMLRDRETPIIARVERNSLVLDPRTVMPDEDHIILDALREIVGGIG